MVTPVSNFLMVISLQEIVFLRTLGSRRGHAKITMITLYKDYNDLVLLFRGSNWYLVHATKNKLEFLNDDGDDFTKLTIELVEKENSSSENLRGTKRKFDYSQEKAQTIA